MQRAGKSERNSSIELLRIIAMVMIVFHHFCYHGGFAFDRSVITLPRLWYNFILMFGRIGVNIFALISGYFLIDNDRQMFNWSRIARFWGQIFFYSVAITLTFTVFGKIRFSAMGLIEALFPITFAKWWFAGTYFVLYLLHPYINLLLRSLDRKKHQSLILCLLIFWSVIPTLTRRSFENNNLLWFIALYCLAAYIRLYGLNPRFKSKHYFLIFFIVSALTYLSSFVFSWLGTRSGGFAKYITHFYLQNAVTSLLIALSLFMAFATWKMPRRKWINVIASATFGVYLIHDDPHVRSLLWMDVFKNASYQNSNAIIGHSILAVSIIFIACILIDLIRQNTVEKAYMLFINRYLDRILSPFRWIYNRIRQIVFGADEVN